MDLARTNRLAMLGHDNSGNSFFYVGSGEKAWRTVASLEFEVAIWLLVTECSVVYSGFTEQFDSERSCVASVNWETGANVNAGEYPN